MTISSSLASAVSGLNAASRNVEVISNNIANAATKGYGRRELVTEARSIGSVGQGVRVVGVRREADMVLISDRRISQAASGADAVRAAYYSSLESAIGTTDSAVSIGSRIDAFDTALIAAAANPGNAARLDAALQAAGGLVRQISDAAETVQELRQRADGTIADQVEQLNAALRRVSDLNGQIRGHAAGNADASALMDQRQQVIDSIAAILPIREVQREFGQIALYAVNGAALVEGPAAQFGFAPTAAIGADTRLEDGELSGLTLNGRPVALEGSNSPIAGGAMQAQFQLRDRLAVESQAQLDALARDLVERFATPGLDGSVAAGAPGLFTDNGAAFDPQAETGLAQRLAVNAAADPQRGGALWRLRDGLEATAAADGGNAQLLVALQGALTERRPTASGGFMAGDRSLSALQGELISSVAAARLGAEAEASFSSARTEALVQQEEAGGVDTDFELQSLLMVEQAYAANAKVIQIIGQMLDKLMEM